MTLNGVMAVTLRYFTEFGKHAFHTQPPRRSVAECTSLLYFVVRVRCRRKESSRSLSHLLMSFLYRYCLLIFNAKLLIDILCRSVNNYRLRWISESRVKSLVTRFRQVTQMYVWWVCPRAAHKNLNTTFLKNYHSHDHCLLSGNVLRGA